jgi:hypothetical protein
VRKRSGKGDFNAALQLRRWPVLWAPRLTANTTTQQSLWLKQNPCYTYSLADRGVVATPGGEAERMQWAVGGDRIQSEFKAPEIFYSNRL